MSSAKEEVQAILDTLLDTGAITSEQVSIIMKAAAHDPAILDQMLVQLKAFGADQAGPSPPLNIEDYYRDGSDTFELLWPLQISLPCSFDQLDRKTRFFVLFQEWSRRELEGVAKLNSGQVNEAAAIFEECLARARQLDVNELVARTFEDLMRVADRAGDRQAARRYSEAAVEARAKHE
jgi:hypothetical protein